MSDPLDERETKAVEALVTAALHVWDYDVTDEEIDRFLSTETPLNPEDQTALDNLGSNPLKSRQLSQPPIEAASERMHDLMALHRKKPTAGFTGHTEQEIKRRREELMRRVLERRKQSND